MSNEENVTTTEAVQLPQEVEAQEIMRGPSGEVGQPTAALTLKQMWHETHFRLEEPPGNKNPRRRVWVPKSGISLKAFARELAASGNEVAKEWFANKGGSHNAKRSDTNVAAAHAAAAATRAEKRKKSSQKQNKSKASAEAPATVVTKGGK